MNELVEKATVCGLVCLGVMQLVVHPRKTYNLLVHGVGWYDMG